MMKEATKITVYRKIHDFSCKASEITELLAIQPYDCCDIGDVIPGRNGIVTRKFSSWILKSDASSQASVEAHIDSLISMIASRKQVMEELAKENNCELTVVIYAVKEHNVGFCIDRSRLKVFLDMGVSLDVDVYFRG